VKLNVSNATLSSPLPKSNNIDLNMCFGEFFREEPISGFYCRKCQELTNHKKKTFLWKEPETMIIHLKKFNVDQYGKQIERKEYVMFSLEENIPFNKMPVQNRGNLQCIKLNMDRWRVRLSALWCY